MTKSAKILLTINGLLATLALNPGAQSAIASPPTTHFWLCLAPVYLPLGTC